MTKICPECMSELPEKAQVCRFCGERIEGKLCPHCRALCKEKATTCKWCNHGFQSPNKVVDLEPFSIKAHRFPTLVFRLRLLPQEMNFSTDKITVSTPGLFFLWVKEVEIPWHKIAGFKYRDGIFWDSIHIETRGQSAAEVRGLRKIDGIKVRQILQQLEE